MPTYMTTQECREALVSGKKIVHTHNTTVAIDLTDCVRNKYRYTVIGALNPFSEDFSEYLGWILNEDMSQEELDRKAEICYQILTGTCCGISCDGCPISGCDDCDQDTGAKTWLRQHGYPEKREEKKVFPSDLSVKCDHEELKQSYKEVVEGIPNDDPDEGYEFCGREDADEYRVKLASSLPWSPWHNMEPRFTAVSYKYQYRRKKPSDPEWDDREVKMFEGGLCDQCDYCEDYEGRKKPTVEIMQQDAKKSLEMPNLNNLERAYADGHKIAPDYTDHTPFQDATGHGEWSVQIPGAGIGLLTDAANYPHFMGYGWSGQITLEPYRLLEVTVMPCDFVRFRGGE